MKPKVKFNKRASSRTTRIAFLANDTPFFFRHFIPAIEAAAAVQAQIFALLPTTPDNRVRSRFAGSMEVLETPQMRRKSPSWAFARKVLSIVSRLRHVEPDIIVGYSIRSIIALTIAFPLLNAKRYVFVVTGLGTTDIASSQKSRFFRAIFYQLMRLANRSSRVWFIFENQSDASRIGIPPTKRMRHLNLMGAGVDPDEFQPESKPRAPPLRLATVGRLVWSKGTDLAAEAVSSLVKEGYEISLDIYGSPDPANPLPVKDSTIGEWINNHHGVHYRGYVEDVPRIWREHHVGIFPTRGGEGLPRALLEAAASGVPTVVTRVPGCEDFVRDGIEGFIVEPESVEELKSAIKKFVHDPLLIAKLGQASRDRVLQTATNEIVQRRYTSIFSLENGDRRVA
ncbi:glycosyltransferase [Bradyrhizobium arachidis]|uniref:glycosyltransferase n=1 Tax=Bradyrhizobium arachidis TaxID=858423 RepID=UPI0021626142|nr:glycosyltransferase [Bradyrhizobium arachidis]UVO39195.1 glycosyltransferase [Bradyrhizobium arachidis]